MSGGKIKRIETENAAKPLGHYSQAIRYNDIVYVSGQLPIDPQRPDSKVEDVKEQARLALENLKQIVLAANSDLNHVLKVTIFLADLSIWPAVNEVYSEFFKDHKPARSAVPTNGIPKGFALEIEAVAAVKS